MKVHIEISKDISEAYAVIHTPILTDTITTLVQTLENTSNTPLVAKQEDTFHILSPEDVYMVRMEDQQVVIYTKTDHYICPKKLYEAKKINAHIHSSNTKK